MNINSIPPVVKECESFFLKNDHNKCLEIIDKNFDIFFNWLEREK